MNDIETRKRAASKNTSKIEIDLSRNVKGDFKNEESDIRGDEKNIAILFFLYLLQGIPLGLIAAIPMYLQNRGVSYKDQAGFSFANWPFSIKLLWAPVVDSLSLPWFGRRKSWLIPVQYLLGIFMLCLSHSIDYLLGDESVRPSVMILTVGFFALSLLAATQDIAVDGWALTMLKRCNVAYASTCNSVGQTAGYFLGYVVFVGLESAEFCNTYLRSTPSETGLVTLSGFLYFWGIVFLVTTTLVAIFKSERSSEHDNEEMTVLQTYKLLWNIIKLPSIRTTILILLTSKIGFAACDAVSSLKLIENGIPKEKLALLSIPMVPLQILLPLIISKYVVGSRPMNIYISAYPYRLCFSALAALLVWILPHVMQNGEIPVYYYIVLILIYSVHQVTLYCMFVAVMAFFARVSDPAVGGTYMTLLNTLANLGGNWPSTSALWLVDNLTYKSCNVPQFTHNNTCSSTLETQECTGAGGSCITWLDGYYIETLLCFIFGWLWLKWGRSVINKLQARKEKDWQVVKHSSRLWII